MDFYDLMNLARTDPGAFHSMVTNDEKMRQLNLSSAQLDALKQMDPTMMRMMLESIENRLRTSPVAGTNACPGTNACVARSLRETI